MTQMSAFARTVYHNKYAHQINGRKEEWHETAQRNTHTILKPYLPGMVEHTTRMIEQRKFLPGGRYLYACGLPYLQINNCFLFMAEDSRDGWAELFSKTAKSLMTGGGIGVVYTPIRPYGYSTRGMGGIATGPCSVAGIVNEQGRRIMQGGSRRSAIWAGLHWWHPDVFRFMDSKDWSALVRQGKSEDFNFPGEMDMTNISVILDDDFFSAIHDVSWKKTYKVWGRELTVNHQWASMVYSRAVDLMLRTGEPGFSVDVGSKHRENLRNACTEVTSEDDCDMCDLGSMNMGAYDSIDEFIDDIPYAIAFLLCGTIASKLPVEQMYKVREKNRRIGLGLMGVHEWLLKRGYRYEPNSELQKWMEAYTTSTYHAECLADQLYLSIPIATRSIAPTGTISIIAETTSGIEPILAVAQRRRYLDGQTWKAQYIIDPTAHRLIKTNGVDPKSIEDAMTLAWDVERRVSFQVWMQKYVDHGISSTINLPDWGSAGNNESTRERFSQTLLKHLPKVRGLTAYPNGSRSGQPLVPVDYDEAISQLGVEFIDQSDSVCKGGTCNS